MSISIYYTVSRNHPLTEDEVSKVNSIMDSYSVDNKIEEYLKTGIGLNWESFCIYENDDENVLFDGATKLPNNSEDATWIGIQHWCEMLSKIRKILNNSSWDVRVEDHEIHWDENNKEYDPSK